MVQPIVAPSILSGDFGDLGRDSQKMLDNTADWLHVDIMDGHFVPNISFGPLVVKGLRSKIPKGNAFLDCHMMVSEPLHWIKEMAGAGADQYTFHYEATDEHEKVIDAIREAGMKVGISIKPKTSVEVLYPLVHKVNIVLIMTVEPGFGGQKFMPDMMSKVQTLRSKYPDLNIEVDGGLGPDTIDVAAKAGANVIVAGTSVYKAKDPKEVITLLRDTVRSQLSAEHE